MELCRQNWLCGTLWQKQSLPLTCKIHLRRMAGFSHIQSQMDPKKPSCKLWYVSSQCVPWSLSSCVLSLQPASPRVRWRARWPHPLPPDAAHHPTMFSKTTHYTLCGQLWCKNWQPFAMLPHGNFQEYISNKDPGPIQFRRDQNHGTSIKCALFLLSSTFSNHDRDFWSKTFLLLCLNLQLCTVHSLTALEKATQATALSKSPRPITLSVIRLTEFHMRMCGCNTPKSQISQIWNWKSSPSDYQCLHRPHDLHLTQTAKKWTLVKLVL